MVRINLTEENLISTAGIADRRFADHSGDIQHGYQLGSLTRGLVAYYPMEEGQGQVLHDGALDNLGQINGASWNGSGQVGSDALDFDGTDDFVNSGNPSVFNFGGGDFAISCWINADDVSTRQQIVAKQLEGGTFEGYYLQLQSDSTVRFYIEDSNGDSAQGATSAISADTWYHLTGVRDGDTAKCYLDGVLEGSGTNSAVGSTDHSDTLGIGAQGNGDDVFNGTIDDVRIYDRALSQPEIEALAGLTEPSGFLVEEQDVPSIDDSGALARYEFEGDVTDSWGDNDGTDNTSAGFVDGVYGQAKDFDGNDDLVDTNITTLSTPLTFSSWFNPNDLSGRAGIISNFTGGGSPPQDVYIDYNINSNGELRFTCDVAGNQINIQGVITQTERWYHVVSTVSENRTALYLDGQLLGTGGGALNGTVINTGLSWRVGWMNDDYHDGQIDDVRIYERALDPIEVETLFNKGAYRIKRGNL